jgi:hypothetical protein
VSNAAITRLLEELEANRAMFAALCLAVETRFKDRAERDAWCIGDHVAHLASYDQVALHQLAPGVAPPPSDDDQDADAWNAQQVRMRVGRSRLSLVGEMTQRRSDCLTLLSRLPEKELRRAVWFPGEARRSAGSVPLRLWLERWSKHDMVHGRAILRATTTLGPQSDFENWLRDDPVLEALDRSAATQHPDGES